MCNAYGAGVVVVADAVQFVGRIAAAAAEQIVRRMIGFIVSGFPLMAIDF